MSKYYGVIGNRDYIKYRGEKRPYWEFLDRQPDGYLTSIIYMRTDLPKTHMIFDCGAWSYKNDDAPHIGKYILSPGYALYECYATVASIGDFVIAPDHMLIDGVDLDARRKLNYEYAKEFYTLCKDMLFHPMATAHGMDLAERIETTGKLIEIGYNHIAIGGVAVRAAQKRKVFKMVEIIRKAFPDVYIHILGLSSPDYTKMWNQLGIDSFDGSSHFKQAFTGGAFFTVECGKLKKWQAARPGEEVTAPKCGCLACSKMREEGIDTRTYGSNEANMGRAAHNQNMLMQAQKIALNGTTVLVSCVGKKSPVPDRAADLYKSDWFLKARQWAENNGDRWFILSAQYGLLDPNKVIEPYEKALNKMPAEDIGAWYQMVTTQIKQIVPHGRVVFLAGEKYRRNLEVVLPALGYHVEVPMRNMGIGQQLQWLKGQNQKEEQLCFG